MTKTKTASAKKSPSLRTLRRKFLAEQKIVPSDPLRPDEYEELQGKMGRLATLNDSLIKYSQDVDERRVELLAAEAALHQAEADLRALKEEHQTAMREAAPLLNRLPTV